MSDNSKKEEINEKNTETLIEFKSKTGKTPAITRKEPVKKGSEIKDNSLSSY